ncbi:MAG: class I SAM-dependent methyltransferase [Candidatus Omnitrophica bacterium]|nr:class I SAM-dependent methyltransferase [Candidatus Omnitrophota bacterium]
MMNKQRFKLPDHRHYQEAWGDEELDLLAQLVYHPLYGLVYRHRYKMALPRMPESDKVLEIGCGYGLFLPALSRRAKDLHAMDIHPLLGRVKSAMEKEGLKRIGFSRADILRLPYKNGSFDTVVCMSVLEHVVKLGDAISEMKRVIKKGGCLVAGFPVKNAVTKMLFKLIGRDDDEIHPNSHSSILGALDKQMSLCGTRVFPAYVPVDLGFYCIGEYRKND